MLGSQESLVRCFLAGGLPAGEASGRLLTGEALASVVAGFGARRPFAEVPSPRRRGESTASPCWRGSRATSAVADWVGEGEADVLEVLGFGCADLLGVRGAENALRGRGAWLKAPPVLGSDGSLAANSKPTARPAVAAAPATQRKVALGRKSGMEGLGAADGGAGGLFVSPSDMADNEVDDAAARALP